MRREDAWVRALSEIIDDHMAEQDANEILETHQEMHTSHISVNDDGLWDSSKRQALETIEFVDTTAAKGQDNNATPPMPQESLPKQSSNMKVTRNRWARHNIASTRGSDI